jgi:hypothetical protein
MVAGLPWPATIGAKEFTWGTERIAARRRTNHQVIADAVQRRRCQTDDAHPTSALAKRSDLEIAGTACTAPLPRRLSAWLIYCPPEEHEITRADASQSHSAAWRMVIEHASEYAHRLRNGPLRIPDHFDLVTDQLIAAVIAVWSITRAPRAMGNIVARVAPGRHSRRPRSAPR